MLQSVFKPVVMRNFPKAIVLLFVALLFACGSSSTTTEDSKPQSAPAAAPVTQAPVKVYCCGKYKRRIKTAVIECIMSYHNLNY